MAIGKRTQSRRNLILGTAAMAAAVAMVGFSFAMVPLFRIVCLKLGLDGTTQRAYQESAEVTDIPMVVRFNANTDKELPWTFGPVEKQVDIKLGETKTIFYRATNHSDKAVTGTAKFNVTPEKTGKYFNKLACFCFQDQTLQPGESVDMGVTFFIDPALVKDDTTDEVRTITLSYTFFNTNKTAPADSTAEAGTTKLTLAPVSGPAKAN